MFAKVTDLFPAGPRYAVMPFDRFVHRSYRVLIAIEPPPPDDDAGPPARIEPALCNS